MAREVMCARLGRRLPGLEAPPFEGPLGQRIYESISAEAWAQWQEQEAALVSQAGLDLSRPGTRRFVEMQMDDFLFSGAPAAAPAAAEPVAEDGQRMVDCVRLGRRLPGLEAPPFEGALGRRIYEQVSAEAWSEWERQQQAFVEQLGLDLTTPGAQRFLQMHMEEYFFAGQPAAGPRMVDCVKLGQRLPALDEPPVPGDLGQRIFEHVSEEAWQLWLQQQTILINHYGLNLGDPGSRNFLYEQMEEFFFGADTAPPDGWTPAGGGKGGAAPAGAGKGGGAPARKK